MRKVTAALVLMMLFVSVSYAGEVIEPDTELHRVIGGLYSLASVLRLNDNPNPHPSQLRRFFTDIPGDWLNSARVSSEGGSFWAGVPVGKYSSARSFLRTHAAELGIMETPGGYAWLGGGYAWLNVEDSAKKLKVSRGSGTDSKILFFSTEGQDTWWQAWPDLTPGAASSLIELYGVSDAPELHVPSGVSRSLYDEVKPASVRVPDEMHVGRTKSSFDVEVEIGDVIFDPIPNRNRSNF